ncbi:type II toxin-antitoxin system RelE/ParE family toxin [Ekhidna sp.]|jgi:plasmid stabilization system protein ParE|uniref:type II toxin-antitoxin system RelE/ParE family toxin n=1 Tax=Ekhidna sp. TaxID=2608089 RepID=UPI0032EF8A4B
MNNYEVEATEAFMNKLLIIIDRIKEDRPTVAKKLRKEILQIVKSLRKMPFRYRQSIYFEDENTRDLIFKGFTIIYEIQNEKVVVFSIVKHQSIP